MSQSGKKNAIDAAILTHAAETEKMEGLGTKIAEIPFTFEARKASCVTRTNSGRMIPTCKGAFEEVLSVCSSIRIAGDVLQIKEKRLDLMRKVRRFNADGYRVILVATRDISKCYRDDGAFNFQGLDTDLTVEGLLTFLDPLKDDAKSSVARLQELGVDTRILTVRVREESFLVSGRLPVSPDTIVPVAAKQHLLSNC
jgi:P-type Mg2+ transporter